MLMVLGLCWVTCPGLVKQGAAHTHVAEALLGHVPWTCEMKVR